MKTLPLWFVLAIPSGCCSRPAPVPAGAPVGLLGPRIGTYLRIEGERDRDGKVGPHSLLVKQVGDDVLPTPVSIWVENLDFPVEVRCVIRGYESGRWIGVPPEVERAEKIAPRQAGWQFQHYFVATSVQAPPELARRFQSERLQR